MIMKISLIINLILLLPFPHTLQRIRQEYMDIESEYLDKKGSYDKVAVGLEMDKQALEKECDTFQVIILLFISCSVLMFFSELLFSTLLCC